MIQKTALTTTQFQPTFSSTLQSPLPFAASQLPTAQFSTAAKSAFIPPFAMPAARRNEPNSIVGRHPTMLLASAHSSHGSNRFNRLGTYHSDLREAASHTRLTNSQTATVRRDLLRRQMSSKEPSQQPLSVEKNLQFLSDLRDSPKEERFEKLDGIPPEMRRHLFEPGDYSTELVSRLTEAYDWDNFQLDEKGIAGLYPYALLAKFPYVCSVSEEELVHVSASYDALSKAGFKAHALHDQWVPDVPECNRVILFERDNEVIISIRGTQGDRDWDINYDIFSKDGSDSGLEGGYHSGYLSTFEAIKEPIEHALQRSSQEAPLSIGIVGHSMGGALAMILAQYLQQSENYDVKRVVTLGAVKGFNSEAAKAYEKQGLSDRTTRVINFVDVVPLAWPNMVHPTAGRLFLTMNGKYWLNPDSIKVVRHQWERFSSQESSGYDGDTREITDHDLVNYIKILSIHSKDDTMLVDDN